MEKDAANLSLYRLAPLAEPGDPRWDNAPSHGEVVVCAYSPADARLVAAAAERDFLEIDAMPGHGNSTRFASALRDDKLYTVVEERGGGEQNAIKRGVVKGDFSFPVIKPDSL